jgi:hypothetical protein
MLRRVNHFRLSGLGVLLAVLACGVACGAGAPSPHTPRNLPSYDAHSAELFDDGIEPEAVGFPGDRVVPPSSDNRLRERTQIGDAVVRGRVTTVNEDTAHAWQLVFHTEETLHVAGQSGSGGPAAQADAAFTLLIEPTDPSAGIVNSLASHLTGRSFVVFLRTFAHGSSPGDDSTLHFHIASDSKEEVQAVRSAIVLGEVQ